MIKEIRLKNFFSFNDCTIPLNRDVNVLVGINGSGKSNLLKAITLLKEGVAGVGLRKHIYDTLGGFDNIFFKGGDPKRSEPIELAFTLTGAALGKYFSDRSEDIIYTISIFKSPGVSNFYVHESVVSTNKVMNFLRFENGQGILQEFNQGAGEWKAVNFANPFEASDELILSKIFDFDRFNELSVLRRAIAEIVIYSYFDTTSGSTIRRPIHPTSDKRLQPDGGNLTQILNTIKINHKRDYQKLIEKLNEVNPQFKGVDFNFVGGNIELMLEESNFNSSVHVSHVSDGTLRYLCLLSILYNPDRGTLICIDEPETGLHPDMIANITRAIFGASEGSTLIIPTHSDVLLDNLEVEHLRVFERNSENASVVLSYTQSQFEGWYENYSLGRMWRNGDIGGNRW